MKKVEVDSAYLAELEAVKVKWLEACSIAQAACTKTNLCVGVSVFECIPRFQKRVEELESKELAHEAELAELRSKAAEIVAELQERSSEANRLSAFGYGDAPSYHTGRNSAFESAADLVESMFGLASCGEGCDGNCELTTYGPTKAETEIAELRSKAAEIVAELRERARVNLGTCAEESDLDYAADLVEEKLKP